MDIGSLQLLHEDRAAEPRDLRTVDDRYDFPLGALVDLSQAGGRRRYSGVLLGAWVGLDDVGAPLVDYADNPCGHPIAARSTISLKRAPAGAEVALLFIEGDPRRPLIVGLIQPPEKSAGASPPSLSAEADGERIEITAEREIVLRCGEASITLTRAGKIILRGSYVLSRSSGVNRIKGGSVQIN